MGEPVCNDFLLLMEQLLATASGSAVTAYGTAPAATATEVATAAATVADGAAAALRRQRPR